MDDKIKRKYSEDTTAYDDTLAELERSQNFKSYYNQAIQNYNMKQNTQKYLDSMLQNQGLASQGYGTSAHVGVENNAMNLYAQNASDYYDREAQITSNAYDRYQTNLEKEEDKQIERDEQLATFISASAGSPDDINKHMYNFGYIDENGNYTEKWNELSDDRKAYITSLIDIYSKEDDSSSTHTFTPNNLANSSYMTNTGEIRNIGTDFGDQLVNVIYNAERGRYEDGEIITLEDKKGRTLTLKYNKNGTFEIIDPTDEQIQEAKNNKTKNKKEKEKDRSKMLVFPTSI